MMRLTRCALRLPTMTRERPTSAAPLITRTRSWRGNMQVRIDEGEMTTKRFVLYGVLGAPIRVFGSIAIGLGIAYLFLGHDEFMFQTMGYESEMQYEGIVNPINDEYAFHAVNQTKTANSPVRALEKPLHPKPVFEEHLQPLAENPAPKKGFAKFM